MAKILYEVKQNLADGSKAFGKWFARVKALETLNTRKLAKESEDRGPRHVLHYARKREGRRAEKGGLFGKQAHEGAAHPIPARADYRGEHLQP